MPCHRCKDSPKCAEFTGQPFTKISHCSSVFVCWLATAPQTRPKKIVYLKRIERSWNNVLNISKVEEGKKAIQILSYNQVNIRDKNVNNQVCNLQTDWSSGDTSCKRTNPPLNWMSQNTRGKEHNARNGRIYIVNVQIKPESKAHFTYLPRFPR